MARGSAFESDVPASPCPRCGSILDVVTGEREPHPGDYSGCVYCGAVNRFDENLRLRPATKDEIADIRANPRVSPQLNAFLEVRVLDSFMRTLSLPQPRKLRKRPSITCPQCRSKSYYQEDIRRGYCGRCHAYTGGTVEDPRA